MRKNMIDEQRVLQTFLELVEIDNPSGQEQQMAAAVIERLRMVGLEPEQFANGSIIARLAGEGEPILLSAHLDSVAPAIGKRAIVENGVVRSAGDTVLGSDDLAGVTAILEGVRAVRMNGRHRAAELVFTVQEEVGLVGARGLDYTMLRSRMGVAFDLNGELGGICVSAPAQESIRVAITGRAAHAGVAPEQGINAVRVAAEAIAAMPLGRIDEETTANVGIIQGGTATNIVPEHVTLQAEARSRDEQKLDRQVAAMRAALEAAAERHGATVDWQSTRAYGPIRIADDAPIVTLCQRAARAAGFEPRLVATGGGSDVNIFNMHGIAAVNLSVGYKDIHSTNEHIAVDDIAGATRLVSALLSLEP
jgi:tripeptide aminopeptidase